MAAAVPVSPGVRAKVTADTRGSLGCHMVFNEEGFGKWQRGAGGLPPSFALGACVSPSAAPVTAGTSVSVGQLQLLRLIGERAVTLPAFPATPLLLTATLPLNVTCLSYSKP